MNFDDAVSLPREQQSYRYVGVAHESRLPSAAIARNPYSYYDQRVTRRSSFDSIDDISGLSLGDVSSLTCDRMENYCSMKAPPKEYPDTSAFASLDNCGRSERASVTSKACVDDDDDDYWNQKMPAIATSTIVSKEGVKQTTEYIEISPGNFMRMRGAEETLEAVQRDFFMPCECVSCGSTLFCIQDADCVVCPNCKMISPMEGVKEGSDGGVGLGFSFEDLACWQLQNSGSRGNLAW